MAIDLENLEEVLLGAEPAANSTLREYRRVVDRCDSSFYGKLLGMDPAGQDKYLEARREYTLEIQARIREVRISIAQKESPSLSARLEAGATSGASASLGKQGHYFQKSKFPEFSGSRRDYPGFRKEWRQCVSPNYDEIFQLREISKRVPKEVEPDVKNAIDMN